MAVRADISESEDWFTNADHVFEYTVYKRDDVTLEDISGWPLIWLVKRRPDDPDSAALLIKEIGSGIEIVDGPNGRCDVTVIDDDTVNLKPGTYYVELKRNQPGEETPLSYGEAVLKRSLHRQ
jgi:hypothetical protein